LYLLAPTTLLRFTLGWMSIVFCSIGVFVVSFFRNKSDAHKGFGAYLIKKFCGWAARIVILSMSGVYIEEIRPQVNYKKYLGEDWKPDYDRPGSIVSNHQCWLDIMMHMYR